MSITVSAHANALLTLFDLQHRPIDSSVHPHSSKTETAGHTSTSRCDCLSTSLRNNIPPFSLREVLSEFGIGGLTVIYIYWGYLGEVFVFVGSNPWERLKCNQLISELLGYRACKSEPFSKGVCAGFDWSIILGQSRIYDLVRIVTQPTGYISRGAVRITNSPARTY